MTIAYRIQRVLTLDYGEPIGAHYRLVVFVDGERAGCQGHFTSAADARADCRRLLALATSDHTVTMGPRMPERRFDMNPHGLI